MPIREQMQWLRRILMEPHERRLNHPEAYRQPLDRAVLLAEVKAQRLGDHETQSFVEEAITHTNPGGPLTIAALADAYESLKEATRTAPDRHLHEFGVIATCGQSIALEYLIRRANGEPEWPAVGRPRKKAKET